MSFHDGTLVASVFDGVKLEDIITLLKNHGIYVGPSIQTKRDYLYYFIGNCNIVQQDAIRNAATWQFHEIEGLCATLSTSLLLYVWKTHHPDMSKGNQYSREEILRDLDGYDLEMVIHNQGWDVLEPTFIDGTSVTATAHLHHKSAIVDTLRLLFREHLDEQLHPPTFKDGILVREEYNYVTTPILQWLCRQYSRDITVSIVFVNYSILSWNVIPTFHNNTPVIGILSSLHLNHAMEILQSLHDVPLEMKHRQDIFIQFCAVLPMDIADAFVAKIRKEYDNCIHYTKRLRTDHQTEDNSFLRPVDQHCLHQRLTIALNRTSNGALQESTCVVCAHLQNHTTMESMDVTAIPHPHLLRPMQYHPSHILSHDMLLYGQEQSPITGNIHICLECLRSLTKMELPRLALANNMWLGHVPPELEILMLPERILVACYFPAAYIIKLYPKIKNSKTWNPQSLSSGIKGNVSTYPLPHAYIASFIDGHQTMPPHPTILSALIGITFIQPNDKPQYPFPRELHVHC
ncbi:hypothetical protein IW262DRAFT_1296858 [Armillaria fumosa]|nr:hypothetical protein IW262DRAFT_1296858 [Armillaria fumosa]